MLSLGGLAVEVRHTPGHSPGHVVFSVPSAQVVFCGDLIFRRSVGRTDLPGSNRAQLTDSIRSQIYTLTPATRLLAGHGPETTVGEEIADNPYV
jgi:hydroxyacylglutathione hydrolase